MSDKRLEPMASAQYRVGYDYFKIGVRDMLFRWCKDQWIRSSYPMHQLRRYGVAPVRLTPNQVKEQRARMTRYRSKYE